MLSARVRIIRRSSPSPRFVATLTRKAFPLLLHRFRSCSQIDRSQPGMQSCSGIRHPSPACHGRSRPLQPTWPVPHSAVWPVAGAQPQTHPAQTVMLVYAHPNRCISGGRSRCTHITRRSASTPQPPRQWIHLVWCADQAVPRRTPSAAEIFSVVRAIRRRRHRGGTPCRPAGTAGAARRRPAHRRRSGR